MKAFSLNSLCVFVSFFLILTAYSSFGQNSSFRGRRVMEVVFTRDQILALITPSPDPQTRLAGVVFKIRQPIMKERPMPETIIFNGRETKVNIPSVLKGNEFHLDEYVVGYRTEWDGVDDRNIRFNENSRQGRSNTGGTARIVQNLDGTFDGTREFELVFFKAEDLRRLATYMSVCNIESTGILFIRTPNRTLPIAVHTFQAYPNPRTNCNGETARDAMQTVIGIPCPPVWGSGLHLPNSFKLLNQKVLTTINQKDLTVGMLVKAFKEQIK